MSKGSFARVPDSNNVPILLQAISYLGQTNYCEDVRKHIHNWSRTSSCLFSGDICGSIERYTNEHITRVGDSR